MDVTIGAEVRGSDGKLGDVHRVIVDARTGHVTDLVVKHGFLFGNERVVPLSSVTKVENGVVYLDTDKEAFERFHGFA
ncbi:MAG TPA: PRC-barrel domain-containing protein, partial [Dehalococcoidia bacterium]